MNNKMRELKKIEQEIGIDLTIFLKALKNGVYVAFLCAHIPLDDFIIDVNNKRFIKHIFIGNAWDLSLDFKDYGETWARTEEELQGKERKK